MATQISKETLLNKITDVLHSIGLYSDSAKNLIAGTIAHESNMGYYRKQVTGPALGIIQMEPFTHDDIVNNYLSAERFRGLRHTILSVSAEIEFDNHNLIMNDYYAIAMCRCHYLRVPDRLPASDDIEALAAYWKKHYNTYLGAGTEEQFINHFKKYIL